MPDVRLDESNSARTLRWAPNASHRTQPLSLWGRLWACLFREARRSQVSSPNAGHVACQTNGFALRLWLGSHRSNSTWPPWLAAVPARPIDAVPVGNGLQYRLRTMNPAPSPRTNPSAFRPTLGNARSGKAPEALLRESSIGSENQAGAPGDGPFRVAHPEYRQLMDRHERTTASRIESDTGPVQVKEE